MKWITRERVKVDRVACPWLIKKFIDPQAEFIFVSADAVMSLAEREGAIPFDVPDVELGHHDGKSSFEAMVRKYQIEDPAISLLAEIVHGADVAQDLYGRAESGGEQQRAALARALVGRPGLLLLDEPLSSLDADLKADLLTELERLQRTLAITTVYVTHDRAEATGLAHRVVRMANGRIEGEISLEATTVEPIVETFNS